MLRSSETGNGTRAVQPAAKRKFWGWGLEGQGLTVSEIEQLGAAFAARFGIDGTRVQEPPRVDELELPAPRLAPPRIGFVAAVDLPGLAQERVLFSAPAFRAVAVTVLLRQVTSARGWARRLQYQPGVPGCPSWCQ